jgi:hypothetical protein
LGAGCIAPAVLGCYEQISLRPFESFFGEPNALGQPPDTVVCARAHRAGAFALANGLTRLGVPLTVVDQAHRVTPLAHGAVAALTHLDWDRWSFVLPVVPFGVNPFGSRTRDLEGMSDLDEMSLRPWSAPFAFDVGRALAAVVVDTPWRVVLAAAAGWSHANDTARSRNWLSPDVAADQELFATWRDGNVTVLRDLGEDQLEQHGWWELLVWSVLAGAMCERTNRPVFNDLSTTHIFNSNWVTTVFTS